MKDLVTIYECLCDQTRLRILNLLCQGPLCVCHIQDILHEPQVKVSKHLGYLKTHGMVDVRREGNWRVYSLAGKRTKALEANLACLQDCAAENKVFRRDSEKLKSLRCNLDGEFPACCAKPQTIKFKTT
jgi:ArsR family transcriptional regulator